MRSGAGPWPNVQSACPIPAVPRRAALPQYKAGGPGFVPGPPAVRPFGPPLVLRTAIPDRTMTYGGGRNDRKTLAAVAPRRFRRADLQRASSTVVAVERTFAPQTAPARATRPKGGRSRSSPRAAGIVHFSVYRPPRGEPAGQSGAVRRR